MKKTIFILAALLAPGCLHAQNPKWFKKAAKAQITIMTLDGQGQMLQSGSGFFIGEDGTALADFELFKRAQKAKVVCADGKEYEVDAILGASSLYDIVKFRVKTEKKTPALNISGRLGVKKEHVYVLPYPTKEDQTCLNDTLFDIQKFEEEYGYYTLGRQIDGKYLNSPVMDEEGEVLGMIQRKAENAEATSYAISVAYGNSLATDGLSAGNDDLNAIGIRKALPTEESDARTFLFMMAARCDSATYGQYLDEYAALFPESSDAYTQRADFYMAHGNYAAAEGDLEKALDVAEKKDETYYTLSKLLYELNLRPGYQPYKDWDFQKSLAFVREAYALNPLPLYVQQEANVLYALKDYEQACEKFLSLKETNMRSADIFRYAAQCKRMAGADTLQVLALQDSAVACFTKPYMKDAAPALLDRAGTLLSLKRYREAVLDLNEYGHLMSDQVNAQFQQAMDDIDRAIRMAPDEPLYHAERAVVLYRIGEPEEAIKAARRATELDPGYAEAYRLMGICQLAVKQREEGQASLRKAAELGDETAKSLLEEGENSPIPASSGE